MTTLTTQPELMATAAADVADIRSAIGAANAAAAGRTTGLLAAAGDEVSAACATLFNTYGAQYQAVLRQASAFHGQFAQALAAAGTSYAEAESANATGLAGALGRITSPIQSLLGGTAATSAAAPAATPGLPTDGIPLITNSKIALIIGGSGTPIPSSDPGYVTNVFNNYLAPKGFGNYIATELFTPEGLYPFQGSKELTLDQSVSEGVTILNNTLFGTGEGQHGLLVPGSGNQVVVWGLSQSADIASIEMQNLALVGNPSVPNLSFVLAGNQMNPNGGILARFPDMAPNQPLRLPSLGFTFYGATPDTTPYQTTIYTLQYDGYADFPRYPLNILSDLNAFIGIETVHGQYASIDPSTLPSNELVLLPGSTGVPSPSGEAVNTSYYMITPPGLPLVAPLRAIPLIGNPLADLVQPDLTTLVNLGYGNPNYGYSAFPGDNVGANAQTTFGVFHPVNASLVANDLVTGAQQGANAFVSDLSSLSLASVQSGMSHTLTSMAGTGHTLTAGLASALASPASFTDSLQTLIANSGNAITSAGASLTEIIQPTIDVANALVTTMPIYDVNLFLQGIGQAAGGDVVDGLVNAFLLPLAADTALLTLAGGFELVIVMNGVGGAVSAIGGLV